MQPDAVPFSRPSTPSAQPLRLGWYGLGAMGYFMARNLANSQKHRGLPVLVHNRSPAKAEKLVKEVGSAANIARSPAELVTECDVIFTNLANDAAVTSVYNDFAKALAQSPPTKPKIFVDTSTVYPSLAGEVDKVVSGFPHCHFVTAPVFGPPPAADAGKLVIALSGDYRSKKEAAYLLVPAVGRKAMDLGGNVEKAPTLKLIGNSLIMGANELLSETFTLGDKSGIGAPTVLNLVKDIMPAPGMVAYGEKMVNDRFDGTVGFAIDGGIKDANHIRRLTAELNSPMPAVDIAHQRMITARAIHESHKAAGTNKWDIIDWSALIAGSRVAAGLDPFDSSKGSKVVRDD
ncbi:NAD(P)-binding protein [Hygrophoropsis aurantiaca]|uniref:NAD(P)-binding protein n=1 Tax=Hygrophoropsis aurantiaca TaxID=72124 RepID=A0ACB8ANG5_9AGAM|nr:NAD(P)-binding protein [Hygrophoropsis aurantiaca]